MSITALIILRTLLFSEAADFWYCLDVVERNFPECKKTAVAMAIKGANQYGAEVRGKYPSLIEKVAEKENTAPP